LALQTVTLVAAILAFAASLIATGVSIYNARFSRFARERWWEKKVEAYSRIIDALANLVYYHEEHLEAEERQISLSERREDIGDYWKKGHAEVKKATAIGAFLISSEAEAAIHKMWKEQGKVVNPTDWYSLIESNYVASRDCLRSLVEAAKKDVQISRQD